jgi:predicted enzyme related to lactoylglutathione lyase
MITQLKFASIPTRDQQAALDFWTTKVGFEVTTDQPMDGDRRWIELTIPGAQTLIVLFTPDGQEDRIGSFFNGSFACDDVEATYRKLSEAGVIFTEAPQRQPWGVFASFQDPDGNTFILSGN